MSNKLKRWTEEEINYIKENYGMLTSTQIGEYIGRTRSSVVAKAHDLNIGELKKWSEEEENFIKNNYKTMSRKEMSEYLSRTETAIDVRMSRLGLCGMKYNYNRDFFEIIDTEEKAYWLGFIYADGCVNLNKTKENAGEVSIQLKSADSEHLRKFNKSLNGNIPVTFKEFVCTFNNKIHKCCSIRCYSYKMATDLISHGCVERKSFIKDMPKHLDDCMYRHFIRGYFDGNGCISLNSNKQKNLKINFCTASKKMADGLRSTLYRFGISSYITDENGKSTYRVYIAGMKNVDNMIHYMYDDSTIFLDRKKQKQEMLYEKYDIHSRLLRLSEMVS